MKCFFLFIILSATSLLSYGQKTYEFNTTCQQAYREIIQLKLNNGLALIAKAKQQNPDNLIPTVLESYIDFFTLFFNEDPAEYKLRKAKFDERISQLKQGPKTSPFYNFCLGAVYVHKAAVAIKFNELLTAGLDAKRAYQYMNNNKKAFPTFTPNQLAQGGLEAVMGTIPDSYKWVATLFGMKGSVTNGMKTVTAFVNSNDPWAKLMFNEAAFFYCYLKFYIENKKEEALQFIQSRKLDVVNNHLFTYMQANLALNNKQVDLAKNTILNRNKSLDYFQTPVWDFQMGFMKLYHLETTEAINYFDNFLQKFKGKFYVKDVYQKISWCYYLQGNIKEAQQARKKLLSNGATQSDADKQASKEAKTGKWPNVILLKARLLNDGGYNTEALALLNTKGNSNFTKEEEQLEYAYRVGRINDDLKNHESAIAFYLKAIALGSTRTEYYAARAALQIAMIYEARGDKKNAIAYYEKCLDMDNHDYKDSLDQRAKSGIARCKGE
jgi:tetratricopeptide (TPR) repeat protein